MEVSQRIHQTKAQALTYQPQLDGLRAYAVLLVIIYHWFPLQHILNNYFQNGPFGVTVFFVLSGYLITSILLVNKEQYESGKLSISKVLSVFYLRRFLRIFPIYYLSLFLLYLIGFENIRTTFSWHFFYLSNVFFFVKNGMDGHLSHLWSLAVEEQFYVLWPVLILITPHRFLKRCFVYIIAFSLVFRMFGALYLNSYIEFLPFSCFDCFALGGLLAYLKLYRYQSRILSFRQIASVPVYIIIVVFITVQGLMFVFGNFFINTVFFRFYVSIFAVFLIAKASIGKNEAFKWVLGNQWIVYIGKISYGLYLYHPFVSGVLEQYNYKTMMRAWLPLPMLVIHIVVPAIILFLVASLSWYLIEKPMNGLKKYVSY